MFGRSRATDGEAEIGTSRVRKRAKKGRETADAGSEPSRRRVVTAGFGRLAADRKAPRSEPSSNFCKKSLETRALSYFGDPLCFLSLRRFSRLHYWQDATLGADATGICKGRCAEGDSWDTQ
jgi:hypothetical protein